jgi:hypothetical protein
MEREPYTANNTNGKEHPNTATCGDCAHFQRCSWLLSRIKQDRVCDWDPSRFITQQTLDENVKLQSLFNNGPK